MLPSLFTTVLLAALSMDEPMNQEQAVILAKQAAIKQLNLPIEQIIVQQTQAVDWPDSSLGCPQPGMMYMQMITSGFKVLLKAGEKIYPVHVGGGRAVVCVQGMSAAQESKARAAQTKVELVHRARERLAAMLKVDAADIQVHGIRAGKSADISGCRSGAHQEKTGGKRVELEYGNRRYEYHADSDDIRECVSVNPDKKDTTRE